MGKARTPELFPYSETEMAKFNVINIEWDTDGKSPVKLGLPRKRIVEAEDEDGIADALSDEYGWLVSGFEVVED
jgi:hypothetical protein